MIAIGVGLPEETPNDRDVTLWHAEILVFRRLHRLRRRFGDIGVALMLVLILIMIMSTHYRSARSQTACQRRHRESTTHKSLFHNQLLFFVLKKAARTAPATRELVADDEWGCCYTLREKTHHSGFQCNLIRFRKAGLPSAGQGVSKESESRTMSAHESRTRY